MKTRSLTSRISIVVTILSLLVLLATLLTVYGTAKHYMNEQAVEKMQYELDVIELNLNKVRTSIELTAALTTPQLSQCMADTAAVTAVLTDLVKKNPFISCAAVAYAPNRLPGVTYNMPVVANYGFISNYFGDKERNGDYTYSDWYIVPERKGVAFWTDPYVNILDSPVVSYAVPVRSEAYGFEGVLTLAVELNYMNKLLSYQPEDSTDVKKMDQHILFDRNTTFLTTPNPEYIMNETLFTLAESENDTTYSYIGREIVAGNDGQATMVIDGEKSVVAWRILPELHWASTVITPHSKLYAGLNMLFTIFIIVALIGVVVAVSVLIYSVRKMLSPMKQLKNAARELGEGNYDTKLPATVTDRNDEIGVLGREFEDMKNAISTTVEQLEQERKNVQESNQMLTTLIYNVVRHMQLPINSMISFTDGLAALVEDSEEAGVIKNEAKGAGMTILQQFSQLKEMATLVQTRDESADERVVISSDEFVEDVMKGAHQLEERYKLTVNEEYRDRRIVKICTNTLTLETLVYQLIIEAAKVSQTDVVGLYYTLDMKETAFRIMIETKPEHPIPVEDRQDFFKRFAKQQIDAYAKSDFLQLYLCYRTAKNLGARLFVDSEYKEANLFVIEIPRVD